MFRLVNRVPTTSDAILNSSGFGIFDVASNLEALKVCTSSAYRHVLVSCRMTAGRLLGDVEVSCE